MTDHGTVHVIHENPEWFAPLAEAFAREGLPVREWLLAEGAENALDLSSPPPEGVFWSRLSASAHTRGNTHAKDYGRAVLGWLQDAGRRVVNGRGVLELEVSKVAQHSALARRGFDVPRTTAVLGHAGLTKAARTFEAPFIVKHNQGGKGLGVRRFDSHGELEYYAASQEEAEAPADGIVLVQEYLFAAEPFVTRAEFVGGRFVYAVRVDTSSGSFELCPAGPGKDAAAPAAGPAETFSLREGFESHPIVARYEALLADLGVEIAGIEFIETIDGRLVTYDVNTNTNYNPGIEALAPTSGAAAVASLFRRLLEESTVPAPAYA